MSFVHLSIDEANKRFLATQRRHNYTTPTSFLELISFYKTLLGKKQGAIIENIEKLENGLAIMEKVNGEVEDLKRRIEVAMVDVAEEKKKTGALIEVVNKESADAAIEADAAAIQEADTNKAADAAQLEMDTANGELAEALPAMEAAKEAVNCLTKDKIDTVKALGSPPAPVMDVGAACLILLKGEFKKHDWDQSKKMMNNPNQFIESIKSFNAEKIDDKKLEALKPLLAKDYFKPGKDGMARYSEAGSYLCGWMVNVVKYNEIYKKVKPLQDSAAEAEALANSKKEELAIVMEKVRVINEKVGDLKAQLAEAEAVAAKVEADAQILIDQLNMANRLVNGLADEKIRWEGNVKTLNVEKMTMIGDALVSAAFVSYIGPFSSEFRYELWRDSWLIDIAERGLPITPGIDPLTVLSTPTDQAKWQQQGLQADRVSNENASIVSECARWPLLIDP
jgi:dynein heavy chain